MAAVPTKQYGLILPMKKDGLKSNLKKPSVFGDDSDDETTVGESLQKEAIKKKMMKQTRLEMQKALEEDSTVYDYDAVYDDIQKQRSENVKKVLSATDKRPKYIHQLMAAVKDRKKEQDQRKIRKEREAEGDKFSDKESYITSAYKKKLLEEEEEEERERRKAEIEDALDVKKQQDLSGFYRHLLNQTIGEEKIPDRAENKHDLSKVSKDAERRSPSVTSPTSHDNIPSSCSDSEEGHEQKSVFNKLAAGSAHSKRQYRQRSPTSGSGEDKERERERDRERHSKSHRDRDRDRHRDRDRDRNRVKERDDRHGGRRDDRDRREDRDRGREDDRSRGRGDTEREDRSGKRGRSPRDRKRNRSGEREKRRSTTEDERKDKDVEEAKERRGEEDKEKPASSEATDKKKEGGGEQEKEETKEKVNKFAKRTTDQAVSSARDRYMARQMARSASKSYIEKEED